MTDITGVTERKRADFTEGSIIGSILKMGVPSMIGFLAQHIYTTADMFWISRLPEGEAGVAALTFFTNLLWMLFSFNSLVGPGSVAIISRRYGEKAFDLTEKAIKETIILKLFFGALLGIVGFFLLEDMLTLLGAKGDALRLGLEYGNIILIGLPIMYATYSIFTALRGVANPNLAMTLMMAANGLNVILDPLVMFGYFGLPAWGIKGAAYASVFSFGLVFLVGLVLFRTKYTNVNLHLVGKQAVSIASMWKIISIGIPAWIGELSFSLSRLMITPQVAGFGTAVVAAYGAGLQLFNIGIAMLVGIGLGLSALIGHNMGADKKARAKETGDKALLLGIGIMAGMGLLTFFFARFYMNIFFNTPETIEIGVTLLKIFALSFPFFGVFIMLEQIHSGVGLNTPNMVVSMVHSWGLQVLPAVLVTKVFGFNEMAVWWVLSGSGVVTSIAFYAYYRRGRWLTFRV